MVEEVHKMIFSNRWDSLSWKGTVAIFVFAGFGRDSAMSVDLNEGRHVQFELKHAHLHYSQDQHLPLRPRRS